MDAPTKFDIFMACQQMSQTMIDMRSNADKSVSTEDYAWATHTEVLFVLETQLSKLLLRAQTSLQAITDNTRFRCNMQQMTATSIISSIKAKWHRLDTMITGQNIKMATATRPIILSRFILANPCT